MVSLIALIALGAFIGRFRWRVMPMAMLMGLKGYLVALVTLTCVLLVLVIGIGTTRAIVHPVAVAALRLFPEGPRRLPDQPSTGGASH